MANDKVVAWIKAARLRTLPLSFSVIIVGSTIALELSSLLEDEEQLGFSWLIFSLTLITTLFLQVLSNFANDYGDAKKGTDNEGRIGPERAVQSGILSLGEMKTGMVITALLSLISGIILLIVSFGSDFDWQFILFILLGLLSIAAAIKYTVGKGAYGYHALGDLFVFIFFGGVGICGSYYLQAGQIGTEVINSVLTFGSLCVAVLNLNNMRDRVNDEKVGKRTFAVVLGFEYSKYYHLLLFLIAWSPFIIRMIQFWPGQLTVFVWYLPVLIIHVLHLIRVFKIEDPKDFDPELKKIALSTFLLSLIMLGISLVFVYAN